MMYNARSDCVQTLFPTRYDISSKKKRGREERNLWDKENIGLEKEGVRSSKGRRKRRAEEGVLGRLNDSATPRRDRDPDDFFKPSSPSKIFIRPVKSYVENVFKDVEDMEANFKLSERTPRRGYSGTNASLLDTPKCSFLASPSEPSSASSLVKSARRQAMIEGHNDFQEILKKCNIDSSHYFTAFFSSGKKGRRSGGQFKCSTPVASPAAQDSTPSKTPDLSANRIKTPAPLSGVQRLVSTPCDSSPLGISAITPSIKDIIRNAADAKFLLPSPEKVPPEVKSAILTGVVCYVEVRSRKENRSDAVSAELLTLGAKIEKNFTKKVTHVVFNEGRVSTYLKAKKEGVPLVSVLWIEACKMASVAVDPLLYRPTQMDRYDDILPFQTIKKRRLPFLKTAEKTKEAEKRNKSLTTIRVSSPEKMNVARNAITERKSNSGGGESLVRTERHCTKKLEFFNDPQPRLEVSVVEILDDSVEEGSSRKEKKAKEGSAKRKWKDIREYLGVQPKKRKLFNPEETFLSGAPSAEDDKKDEEKVVGAPSQLSSAKSKRATPLVKRSWKKVVCGGKATTKEGRGKSKAKRGLLSQLSEPLSVSRRSSISLFLEPAFKKTPPPPKPPPSVVFTSLTSSEIATFAKVVKKLGVFTVEANVTNSTTHVVTDKLRRTVNMLKGIVRGCWILSTDWIQASEKAGKWLSEENFELSEFSPAVVYCRKERQAFGSGYCMELFAECGGIYVSRDTAPPWRDLEELVRACHGKPVTQARAAEILIGRNGQPPPPPASPSAPAQIRLSEKWILDSITRNKLLPYDDYLIA